MPEHPSSLGSAARSASVDSVFDSDRFDTEPQRRRRDRHAAPRVRVANFPWMQLFVPGLAQLRSGQRALGIVGLIFAFVFWLGAIMFAIVAMTSRSQIFSWVTREAPLTVLIVVSLALALVFLLFGISTVRLVSTNARRSSTKWVTSALVVLVTLLQVGALGFVASTANSQRQLIASLFPSTPDVTDSSGPDGSDAPPPPPQVEPVDGRYNILLLGGDAGEGRTGLRPDSISVVSIDAATGKTTIIGVPRNLEQARFSEGSPMNEKFPNGYDCGHACLISFLYTYASGNPGIYTDPRFAGQDPGMLATRDAVEGVTGLTIPYIVLIDMDGFADLVDSVGGIEVDVPRAIESGDPRSSFRAGPQHMDGTRALQYSRTRFESSDYDRMSKQRLVQEAFLRQIDPLVLVTRFQALAGAGSRYIKTTIPQDALSSLLDSGMKASRHPTTTVELVPPQVNVSAPDFDAIHRMVAEATHAP